MDRKHDTVAPAGASLHFEPPARLRKRPRQERSVALVDALKESCRAILEQGGEEALSLHRISEHAGVAVSSIYEYFPTLEALVAAVFEDFRRQTRSALASQILAMPPSATLAEAIDMMLRAGLAATRRWLLIEPAFFAKSAQYDELVRLELVRPESTLSSVVSEALIERFSSEIRLRDADMARFFVHQTLVSLLRSMALMRPEYLDDEGTPLLLGSMLHALLTTDA